MHTQQMRLKFYKHLYIYTHVGLIFFIIGFLLQITKLAPQVCQAGCNSWMKQLDLGSKTDFLIKSSSFRWPARQFLSGISLITSMALCFIHFRTTKNLQFSFLIICTPESDCHLYAIIITFERVGPPFPCVYMPLDLCRHH